VILQGNIKISGRTYKKGDSVSWLSIYPFFLLHMAMFGGSGFALAYFSDDTPVLFLYAHGGIAVAAYLIFYKTIFGFDEVKWMLINSLLGLYGIYVDIDNILSQFGRTADDYPIYIHVIPFLYYILYTFLIRQALLDLTNSRENKERKKIVEYSYIAISVLIYTYIYLT